MGSDENCDDEFECSECDFKCTSEIEIIQHSAMHQSPSNNNCDNSNISPYSTHIEDESKEDDTVITLQAKVSSEKEMGSCNRLTETSEINALDPCKYEVKREPSSHEFISTTKILSESEIANKRIQLEDMDIKQESCPNYSSNKINEYVNIYIDQDRLGIGSMPSKNIIIYGRESMHSAYNNVNKSTEDKHLSIKTIVEEYGSMSCQSDLLHYDMSLTNSSQSLPPHKRSGRGRPKKDPDHKSSIELEIDNTGIYIPPGWDRKLYMRTTLCNGQLRYDCYYYTESGKQIRSKRLAYEYYANKNHLAKVDIEKLNFSISHTIMKPNQPFLEVYLDNTGIYIPEGWQRKIYINEQKNYYVNYLNAEGSRFGCKSDVYAYQSNYDSNKEKQIDVDEMNFSRGIRNRISLKKGYQSVQALEKTMTNRFRHNEYGTIKYCNPLGKKEKKVGKIEIEIDNTGKYIPEGWQRKAYKYTKGAYKDQHVVRYISPLGKTFCSKKLVSEYIVKSESNGISELINVDKMDFSWKSHMKHRNALGKIEIQIDNTGKYIPEGWQRKAYKYTKGAYKGLHVVRYISPLGKTLRSKTQVSEYIERLENNECMEPINVDNMDFSWKSHLEQE
ncbi:unnamed protein product [Meganyctiphanes norvegica]|uniref:MBD domain-containing protein n=1 Tax=Meganyctiphanes norvegica TaxID=48144 RepID=A0AAV2Q6Q5_MEGNR